MRPNGGVVMHHSQVNQLLLDGTFCCEAIMVACAVIPLDVLECFTIAIMPIGRLLHILDVGHMSSLLAKS